MTNPLEQIRELAEKWQNPKGNSDIHLAGIICGNEILKILDASQGYVCVPVEDAEWLLDAIEGMHGGDHSDAYCKHCASVNRVSDLLAASRETNRE